MSSLRPLFILQIDLRFVFLFFLSFCKKDFAIRFDFSLACLVCFRRPVGGQGEEQEDGGGDGGRLPGYPEHVILPLPAFKQTNLTLNTCLKNTPWTFSSSFWCTRTPFLCKWIHSGSLQGLFPFLVLSWCETNQLGQKSVSFSVFASFLELLSFLSVLHPYHIQVVSKQKLL